jgi:hypothetical protein
MLAPVDVRDHSVGVGQAAGTDASLPVRVVTTGDEGNHSQVVRRLAGRPVVSAQVVGVTAEVMGVNAQDQGVTAAVEGVSAEDRCRYDAGPGRSSRGEGRERRCPRGSGR